MQKKYTLNLFDTLERREKPIIPSDGKTVRMYTCGPTIYDFSHIGNFRTFLFEDLLRRTLKSFGFAVTQVMNLTDIDDKTIRGARQQNIPLKSYTDPFKEAFFQDLVTLRIEKAEYYPEATIYIPEMIDMILLLEDKGFAYRDGSGNVYFSISKFKDYGKLSHLDLSSLRACKGTIVTVLEEKCGSDLDDFSKHVFVHPCEEKSPRDESIFPSKTVTIIPLQALTSEKNTNDEYAKEGVADFVLWKAHSQERDGDFFWESPFGKGRPGWHLECSVMARKLLGDTIDLHAGGVDLIFPHHENEIAQSEAATGKLFSHNWAHAEHLLVENRKMSKSLGNFYTLRDLLAKEFSPSSIRYFLISSHYRTQLNFTFQGVEAAASSVKRIRDFYARLENAQDGIPSQEYKDLIDSFNEKWNASLSSDLNTSEALSALFDCIRQTNYLLDHDTLSPHDIFYVKNFMKQIDSILDILRPEKDTLSSEVELLTKSREDARKKKNWAESDRIRDQLHNLGFIVEDTSKGQRISKA